MKTIAFLGGSFDPVHTGHLWMAQAVQQAIRCQLRFMPTPLSPLKLTQTHTKTRHRVAMLRQVLRDTPFLMEDTELHGPSPASSFDTFERLRQKYGKDARLIFIMGQDSLETLPDWKGGFDILNYTHLWVFPRASHVDATTSLAPHSDTDIVNTDAIPSWAKALLPAAQLPQVVLSAEQLQHQPCGHIYFDSRIPPLVSSTHIRSRMKSARHLVHKRVFAYSRQAKLYLG